MSWCPDSASRFGLTGSACPTSLPSRLLLEPTPIVYDPPLLCIEILSREDRMSEMLERVDDYISFGVSCVWVLDPRTHRAFVYTAEGMHEPKDGVLRAGSDIAVPMAELES